ncbi:MAG: PD40 domain-containing protein, partial [Acidobacteriota bacterium]
IRRCAWVSSIASAGRGGFGRATASSPLRLTGQDGAASGHLAGHEWRYPFHLRFSLEKETAMPSPRPLVVPVLTMMVVAGSIAAGLAADAPESAPHGAMLRYPDVSATHIVFVYADDLWLVPREGGTAAPLARASGVEALPRFSPDGESIVFIGNYGGGNDLYTLPVGGGVPYRVTYHPATEVVCDWTPDGRILFFQNGLAGLGRMLQIFAVAAEGGLPEKLPVPYGAFATMSPDGEYLLYTPDTRDTRTWKRYRGGLATDLWLFHLEEKTSRRITDWEGTDTQPMWHGRKIYYLSDAGPEHRLNIWSFDLDSGQRQQITTFSDYDVKWPAIGPGPEGAGEIVFQHGARLRLLDLASLRSRIVEVKIPGARPTLLAELRDVSGAIHWWSLSPTGKRAVVEARGDVWTLPAEHGAPRNVSRTSGVAERFPTWSPDGKWIAYQSDASGEYHLYVRSADGKAEPLQLTDEGQTFRYEPVFSPDSQWIVFSDKSGTLTLVDVDSGRARQIDRDPRAAVRERGDFNFSHDSRFLAFWRNADGGFQRSIFIYELETARARRVTSDMFDDASPAFDRNGDYLFFTSSRSFAPLYSAVDTTFIYAKTDRIYLVPLRADEPSPFAPKSDEEKPEDQDDESEGDEPQKKDDKDEKNDAEDSDKPENVEIAFDRFEQRAVALPIEPGRFGRVAVNDKGELVFVRLPVRGSDAKGSVHLFKLDDDEREEKTIVDGVNDFEISADGKKLLVLVNGKAAIYDAAADAKGKDVVTSPMMTRIDPRAEWEQLFTEAWRLLRDFFYDPNMHGVDWPQIRAQYRAMLVDCTTRQEVGYVIREMISELNVGHAYYGPGPDETNEPRRNVGLLGVDFELANGAYRVKDIHQGAPWDVDARGPLGEPGLDIAPGDYVLAVNGVPVDVSKAPWAAFEGLAGQSIYVTVGDEPRMGEGARELLVRPVEDEQPLRYRTWVARHMATVDEKSGGRVGYIHVPDTGIRGQNELVRQYFGQVHKEALIIDERWNGGGQVPSRFIEMLNRPVTNYWALRDGLDWPWPPDAHHGPKCMLINGQAGSGGDLFPAYFRQAQLGKLIGTRTWGGLVGISGNPRLIDGAIVTVPRFAFYETDGTWGIEGHGVEPDIEVIDDPAQHQDGTDPQLDAAIAHLLGEIERNGYRPPERPAYTDRSGMGIRDEDK